MKALERLLTNAQKTIGRANVKIPQFGWDEAISFLKQILILDARYAPLFDARPVPLTYAKQICNMYTESL